MKRFLCIFIGGLSCGVVGFLVSSGLSHIYERFWAKTGDMSSFEAIVLLGILGGFIIIGGIAGNSLFERNLTRRSSGRS